MNIGKALLGAAVGGIPGAVVGAMSSDEESVGESLLPQKVVNKVFGDDDITGSAHLDKPVENGGASGLNRSYGADTGSHQNRQVRRF